MKTRLIISTIALMLIAACAAFDKDGTPYDGFGPDVVPPPIVAGGQFEGNYKGDMTLTENTCEGLKDEVNAITPLKVNVLQNGDLVSLSFEDNSEASGSMKDGKATVIKRDASSTHIYHLEFSDKGISGDCEYIDKAPVGDQIGEPCAKYTLSLTRE
jgi:hypothetical protein